MGQGKMSPGNGLGKKCVQEMGSGNESGKWVKEKISFTDSSFTDAISQGNAQMYGPIVQSAILRGVCVKISALWTKTVAGVWKVMTFSAPILYRYR